MRRPSFQFYPADWLGNSNLRRCTHAEKGVWVDVMCLAHDSEEYGLLRWPLEEIAQAVGCPVSVLQSLIAKGVLKGSGAGETCEPFVYVPRSGRKDGAPVTLIASRPGPVWYSSRMVRDEYVRKHRGESSWFTAEGDEAGESPKHEPKQAPMPPLSDGSSSSSLSSSLSSREGTATQAKSGASPAGFDELWSRYPKKVGKKDALKAYSAINPDKVVLAKMLKRLQRDKASKQWVKDEGQYIPNPSTWLNRRDWESDDSEPGTKDSAQWAIDAGFPNEFEASNNGCFQRNSHEFKDGMRTVEVLA